MHANVASTPQLRLIGTSLTIGAIIVILVATLTPESGQPMASHVCLVCGPLGGVDSILNVLLFFPLGVGLALAGSHWNRSVLFAFALSVAVETAQLLLVAGRDATLGDVLTNTIGAALGFALARNTKTWLRPNPRTAAVLGVAWCTIWIAIQAVSSFAFAPSIPRSTYFGQIARELGNFDVFPGRVYGASIGGVAVADAHLDAGVAARLRSGATVTATVVPAGLTTRIAPIVRVADAEEREIVLLGQEAYGLVFGIRTGAAVLRLRSPLFELPRVFADVEAMASVDTLAVSAGYGPGDVRMSARVANGTRHSVIALTPALAWVLVLPAQWLVGGTRTERILSLIWLAALTFPVGYWSALAWHPRAPRFELTATPVWLVCLVMLSAGFLFAPATFGLPKATIGEWFAVLIGFLVGALIGTRLGRPVAPSDELRE